MPQTTFITSLGSDEAVDFLMQTEQFHGFELPEYFDFKTVLDFVRQTVGNRPYESCLEADAREMADVNFDMLLNKDGRYAVRPLTLCNPFMYYFLVREICGKEHWEQVKETFRACSVPNIKPCALPVVPEKDETFHKATAILNWWNSLEQRSIELSLEYRYMFVSDITNCYGSINPQSIDWALSRKGTRESTEANHQVARNIIRLLADLQQGRNIGIPQGSTLFDLISEIVLCYSDLLLAEAIENAGITEGYYILRYRDDYRIFCNNKAVLERISYLLQQVLESLNFRMNSGKTKVTDSLITDSIKPDKLYYIANTPIFNKKGCDFDGIQKHLLYILMFSRKYPNAGQLRVMLNDLDKRIADKIKPKKEGVGVFAEEGLVWETETAPRHLVENVRAMSAIATQIAIENVGIAHFALRIVSRMTEQMADKDECNDIREKVRNRLIEQPNSAYTQLWLQNITYRQDVRAHNCPYGVRLCRVVMGEKVDLWNNSWLKPDITKGFPGTSVVVAEKLPVNNSVINFRENMGYY